MTLGPPPVPPEPGLRPAPPPLPPEPRAPGPERGSPGRPASLVTALALALAVSLAVNVILAVRVRDEADRQAELRERVAMLQRELEALRGQGSGGSVLDRIARAAAEIRRLTFTTPVVPEILTEDALRRRVEEEFRRDNPRAEIDAVDAALTALGLLAPRDDLFDILLGVQMEQVAGYYDSETKKLVVTGDAQEPGPLDRVLLVHEYVHALVDQHFDLTRIDRLQDARADDEATALLALAEGDATVAMLRYADRYLTPSERREFTDQAAAIPTERLDAAPRAVREALLFPYREGVQFVQALLARGGTAALDRAYRDPPTSTEQILHPARYLGPRDDPTPVQVPDLARALGPGWRTLEGGEIGELDVRLIVGQFLPRSDADAAAEGWDGGRYAAAQSGTGTLVGVLTVWDSDGEAREATESLGRWLPLRYANRGETFAVSGATGRGWDAGAAGAGLVVRSGARVLLVVGPDRGSVERARAAFGL
jgi:hypothetical protein